MRSLGFAEVAIVAHDFAHSVGFQVDLFGYTTAQFDTYTPAWRRPHHSGRLDHFLGLWEPGVWSSDYLRGSYGTTSALTSGRLTW
ncbi:MAG TPA: hypothetical protein QGI07_00540 [Dehalococcoidia bacterium]|jgi:hypothetical protein|nr:hypothetical protein [Dehalococcoidia bacterium]MDP7161623.1 hypothetical protein [Dehalococcoidia bacterium]MDP7213455.1 hypothetical protein [Dehalococcoidia bacterium]MDP7514283.1 hypothetical protein [Dehalococcoidia bacterium]HJM52501.1 hypothetical protein [Dehalococcoidia bacterium]